MTSLSQLQYRSSSTDPSASRSNSGYKPLSSDQLSIDDPSATDDDDAYFDKLEDSPLNALSLPDPVGAFPDYYVKGEAVTLALKSDSGFNKKKWTIRDEGRDEVVFKAKGVRTTISEKVFTDSQGREVCVLKRHRPALFGDYYLEDMDGRLLMEFQKPGKVLGKTITASFTDRLSGTTKELRIVARWLKGRGIITLDGMFVASIGRAEDTPMLSLTPTYKLVVPEGLDMALMAVVGTVFACWAKEYNDTVLHGANM